MWLRESCTSLAGCPSRARLYMKPKLITVQTAPLDKPAIMELMFPAAQTALASPTPAPSLADIVREKTQGGRLIVRFFLSTMEGEFEDARVHHRVDAAKQLVILQHNSSFSDVVRDETDDGDRIISFLFSVMMGEIEGARQHHRNEAGKRLARLDPKMARALAEDNTPRRSRPLHTGAVGAPSHALHATGAPLLTGADVGTALDEIVRQETNDGRDIVRFYADVMRGVLTDFKTHQRMDAADKLVSLSSDHTPCAPAPTPASDHDTVSAATPWKTPRKPEWRHFEYPEDHTYDFDSYGEEDYRRDRYGDKALVHIFGDDETKSAANQAVLDYKVDQIEAQRAAVHSDHDTCQPSDPPACLVPPNGDDTFGPDTYGYNALVYIYDSTEAARVGYTAAMAHKEKLRLALIATDGYGYLGDTQDPGPDPPEHPPPRRRLPIYLGPP